MRKSVLTAFAIVLAALCTPAQAGNYGLDEYRAALVEEHGPFVSVPTYLGAAVGVVAMFPVTIVNGLMGLVIFSENPTRIAENLLKAPARGWYWGGIVVGTPFRIVKGIIWDTPAALIRPFRRETVPKPVAES